NRRAHIVYGNPAPVLLSRSNLAADTDLEWKQHLLKRSPVSAQHNTKAQVNHADSLSSCRIRRSFPLPADISEESRTWTAVFAMSLGAPIAVVANARGADHDLRGSLNLGKLFREQLCAAAPAVSNSSLLRSRPPAGSNILTSKMNQRADAAEHCLVDSSLF